MCFITIFLVLLLTTVAYTDMRLQRVPNYLTFPAMSVGVLYHILTSGPAGLLFATKGLGLGIALLFIPYLFGGMGAGDAKLMGSVGAFLGAEGVFKAFIFSAIAGGIYAILLLAIHGHLLETLIRCGRMIKTFFLTRIFIYLPPSQKRKELRLYYGVAIAVGTIFQLFFSYKLM